MMSSAVVRDTRISTSAHKGSSIDDLLIEILLRLPVLSLLRFKSVSRRWLSLITDHKFTLRSKNLTPTGLFVQLQRYRSEFAFVPFQEKKSPLISKFNIDMKSSIQPCNGLIFCFVGSEFKFCVYNPTINRFKLLPFPHDWNRDPDISYRAIAFDPAVSPHYKVVYPKHNYVDPRVRRYPIPVHKQIYSSETGKWSVSAKTFSRELFLRFNNGIHWRGALHWIDYYSDEVLHLSLDDIKNPHFIHVNAPKTFNEVANHVDILAVSCNCLLRLHRVQPLSSLQIIVYEMKNDYSRWSVKYHVNLNHITAGDLNFLLEKPYFTIQSIVLLGERKEEPFLVLEVHAKLIQYNIISKTFHDLSILAPSYNGTDLYTFLFNPSLALV